ncbi:AAA family ATPase [Bermanella sp. R86510]|uniref:AAA family ATPase n=1 Tax=unclassified Bermanella TaxID=2627862 RepID=UPI0037C8624D
MIIDRVYVEKFRGFRDSSFKLGKYVTLLAGQNGTQKSTLLGILTQTFTIPTKNHPFSTERPLTGGTYRSAFQEKFRLSPLMDAPGTHIWSLFFNDKEIHPDIDEDGKFSIESIPRRIKDETTVRFWQKGKRDAGSGYVNVPVIYLSLNRLIPIAEAGSVVEKDIQLSEKEQKWFSDNYNQILLSSDDLESIDYLESNSKNTIGVSTDHYDWNSNSAGQDNLGRILLAVISFMRLKTAYPEDYKGGILAIDEIDATLFPASQVKLLDRLIKFCAKSGIQVIATTHSLHLLERAFEITSRHHRQNDVKTVFLKKIDKKIKIEENPSYHGIVNNLRVMINGKKAKKKVTVYTEDKQTMHFVKAIIGRKYDVQFVDITLGCANLIQLGKSQVPSFSHPNSIIILDGDARTSLAKSKLKNYICLPGDMNPESLLAEFLHKLSDESSFWGDKVEDYSKQVCFRDYKLADIKSNRDTAKRWYIQQNESGAWGLCANNVYKYYFQTIEKDLILFRDKFNKVYTEQIKHL